VHQSVQLLTKWRGIFHQGFKLVVFSSLEQGNCISCNKLEISGLNKNNRMEGLCKVGNDIIENSKNTFTCQIGAEMFIVILSLGMQSY
jgi:hypothetical protein